ncbi:hypothetical protein OROHE_000808 [Orobanche hederae]
MANPIFLSTCILVNIFSLFNSASAISSCNGLCQTLNDCAGQLICINRKCNDDPDVGSHICSGGGTSPSPPSASGGSCQPNGNLTCKGESYPKYSCSPPVISSTPAKLTLNNFSLGGDGGGPSECDDKYHNNNLRVVALSTGWYAGGSRCLQTIRIRADQNPRRSTTATVVDECDSQQGCDVEHAYQPPCRNNVVDGSAAVWKALGLNEDLGVVDVNWSMA